MFIGIFLQFISIFGNALNVLSGKFAVAHFHPLCFLCYTLFFNTLFLALWGKIRKVNFAVSSHSHIMLTSACYVIAMICLFASMYLLNPTMIGFLSRFFLVFAIFFGVTLLKERITLDKMVAITLVMIGSFFFASKEEGLSISLLGGAAVISYCFFFALSNTIIKLRESKEDYIVITTYNNGIAFLIVLGLALYQGALEPLNLKTFVWVVVASLCSVVSSTSFFESLKTLSYAHANTLRSFSPIAIALVSWPFFPVKLSPLNIIGCVLILSGTPLMFIIPALLQRQKQKI